MILLDYSQTVIKSVFGILSDLERKGELQEINLDTIRFYVLNAIRSYIKKHKEKYGDLIICCDDRTYWRKSVFPNYKFHRKGNRESSKVDWSQIFTCLNTIREELVENFPYKVLMVPECEADDIIGTLVHTYGETLGGDPILILSADLDFISLQVYSNVEQYDPINKKEVRTNNPEWYLKEKILRGDKGDSIPNFLSPDNTFVDGLRQVPISTKKLEEEWMNKDPEEFCDSDIINNYRRNEKLIDLSLIPENIKERIIKAFESQKPNGRSRMFDYFIKHKLKSLMTTIQEF